MIQGIPLAMGLKENLYRNLSIATFIVCLLGFLWNVFGCCKTFFNNSTTVLSSTQEGLTELPLPAVFTCYRTPFLQDSWQFIENRSILHPSLYEQQTKDPGKLISGLYVGNQGATYSPVQNYTIKELSTKSNGRCLAVSFHQKVRLLFSHKNCTWHKQIIIYHLHLKDIVWTRSHDIG